LFLKFKNIRQGKKLNDFGIRIGQPRKTSYYFRELAKIQVHAARGKKSLSKTWEGFLCMVGQHHNTLQSFRPRHVARQT
jgi:hypothetical protein